MECDIENYTVYGYCLLYTSDAADDLLCGDLGGPGIIKKKKKAYNIQHGGRFIEKDTQHVFKSRSGTGNPVSIAAR